MEGIFRDEYKSSFRCTAIAKFQTRVEAPWHHKTSFVSGIWRNAIYKQRRLGAALGISIQPRPHVLRPAPRCTGPVMETLAMSWINPPILRMPPSLGNASTRSASHLTPPDILISDGKVVPACDPLLAPCATISEKVER